MIALYRVTFTATTKPSHPHYWKSGEGMLTIWMHADSLADALARVTQRVETLPYEIVPNRADVFTGKEHSPEWQALADVAEEKGLAIDFTYLPVGEVWEPRLS